MALFSKAYGRGSKFKQIHAKVADAVYDRGAIAFTESTRVAAENAIQVVGGCRTWAIIAGESRFEPDFSIV